MKVLFVYPNFSMSSMAPMGIAMLSATLKQHGINTKLFDTTFYDIGQNANMSKVGIGQVPAFDFASRGIKTLKGSVFYDLRRTVLDYKPDLIAVSMVEDVFYLGINLLKSIEDLKIPNVIGGVFPTFAPEKVLSEKCIDIVCVGEGEIALLDVCNAVKKGESLAGIPNICYRSGEDIIKTNIREAIKLDDMPIPDYDLFPKKLLYRPIQGNVYLTIGIETQRGCPYTCAFCNSPAQTELYRGAKSIYYRRKSVKKIKQELMFLVDKYNPEFIYWITDNLLAMPEKEWLEFFDMYMQFRLPFWMNTRAETITSERVRQLEEMNCLRCNIGIEHGNYDFRKNVIKRNTTDEELIKGFRSFEKTSITVVANTIIGYPGETEELIWESIRFNRKLAPYIDSISAFIFAPYHGTLLRGEAVRKGYIDNNLIVNAGTTTGSLMKMSHLPDKKLRGLQRTFPLYVKLPELYYPEIKRCERFDETSNALYEKLLNIYNDMTLKNKE